MISALLLTAFVGRQLPEELAASIAARPPAGVTLFREHNFDSVAQLRELTAALQAAAPTEQRPLLVATDQEGGQLMAIGGEATPFAGAMALGAAGDPELAERVARATGRELLAMGVNVNYAPVCDLATEPLNPALGIRSFGDDPHAVALLAAATVRGFHTAGVAATVKHFPGGGDAAADTHHELATVERSRAQLIERELVPFRAALAAGARLVMAGHFALRRAGEPGAAGEGPEAGLPASLSSFVLTTLLRDELGFEGLALTDALDMHALGQGAAQVVDVIAAVRAGQDLLLGTADRELIGRVEEALEQALRRRLIEPVAIDATRRRLAAVRDWLAAFAQPPLDVVGCAEHRALAEELARRSITLVCDDGLLPLGLGDGARIAVVQPRPTDLTPADTSSLVPPALADALRRRHAAVDEFVVPHRPSDAEIAALVAALPDNDLIVLGTVSAHLEPAQAALAAAVLRLGRPTITVALRTPWDLAAYPQSRTHVCTFGILPPSLDALAGALFGEHPFAGRLPVAHPLGR